MSPAHDAIQQQAADWLAKRRDGARSAGEEAAFEAWRRQSEAHAGAYAETERAWEQWKGLQHSARLREMTAAAMAATAPRRRRTTRRWRPLLAAAGLAAVALFGAGLWQLRTPAPPALVYRTGLGEQRTERLTDGTRIILNTQTEVLVRYSRERREVTLQHGEAMFEVAHDADHPFTVIAGQGTVTDLGTQFQVRNEDGMATVTLLQGSVEVAAPAERKQLAPGEQARYGDNIVGIRVRQVDTSLVDTWTHGRMDFSGLPLAKAVAEANRYSAVKLRVGDPRLADLPVGGSFRIGDNAAIAAALASVFPVRVARSDTHEIVLMPR
ncbi:MAG: FecR domain-containing protein [Rudaea sp.]|uniref:FecR family protein n=1 Tax=Rudaea sp. TaxID=2136325 RepID=UPI0039E70B8C